MDNWTSIYQIVGKRSYWLWAECCKVGRYYSEDNLRRRNIIPWNFYKAEHNVGILILKLILKTIKNLILEYQVYKEKAIPENLYFFCGIKLALSSFEINMWSIILWNYILGDNVVGELLAFGFQFHILYQRS